MKSGRKRRHPVLLLMLLSALLIQTCFPVSAAEVRTNQIENWPKGPEVGSTIALLYDADTQTILYDKGATEVRYPASTTKLMTALLAVENAPLDAQLTMSENACRDVTFDSTNINSQPGEVYTLDQAVHAILLASANEVSNMVAEYIGGSEQGFVDMMNQRAAELGCVNTHFANASGLHDDNHWTTAYDLALIMAECMKNETFCQIENDDIYVIQPTNMNPEKRAFQQHHVMMLEGSNWRYDGVFAGKTGFTDQAGHTLVTACTRDGHTLISVTMGGDDPACFHEAKALLDYGYSSFGLAHAVDDAGNELEEYVTVPTGLTLDDLDCFVQETSSPGSVDRSYQKVWSYAGVALGHVSYTVPYEENAVEISSSSSQEEETITTSELLSGIGGDNSVSNLDKVQKYFSLVINTCKRGIDIVSDIAMTIIDEIRSGNPDSPILIFILADAAGLLILVVAILQQRRHRRKKLKKALKAREEAMKQAQAAEQAAAAAAVPEAVTAEALPEEKPIAEEPVVEEPTLEEPIVEEPIIEEPIIEEPIVEEPIIEEPIIEEPIIEEPIIEEPIVEEPVAKEVNSELSVTEEAPAKEQATGEAVVGHAPNDQPETKKKRGLFGLFRK